MGANFEIAQRIKAARLQRNLTQKDVADTFNKTSAAISDIERGRTQITAADLLKFSEILSKPIEYFYGADFGDADIENIIAIVRKLPSESRKEQLPWLTTYLSMTQINYEMQSIKDEEKLMEKAKEFHENFIPFFNTLESMVDKLRDAKEKLETVLIQ